MKMHMKLHYYVVVFSFASSLAKEPELPLCPTNILHYFPQTLPMHCRMPPNANIPSLSDPAQFQTMTPFYQSPPPDKDPPLPIPVPLPGGIPMLPGPPNMPMMPMPMPMGPSPSQKLPVIVMPFYSPDPNFRKPQMPMPRPQPRPRPRPRRRPRQKHDIYKRPSIHSDSESSDTDRSSDDSDYTSGGEYERGFWRGSKRGFRSSGRRMSKKHKHKPNKEKKEKKDVLTPILQYVTKDGYVIYEKTISKEEAKDWLTTKNREGNKEVKNENSAPEEENNGSYADVRKEQAMHRNEIRHEKLTANSQKTVAKPQTKTKLHQKRAKVPK